jgi:hypothetical protein
MDTCNTPSTLGNQSLLNGSANYSGNNYYGSIHGSNVGGTGNTVYNYNLDVDQDMVMLFLLRIRLGIQPCNVARSKL